MKPARDGADRTQSRPHDRSRPGPAPSCKVPPMRYETKIAVIIREDLATWQKLNVACFLAGGLAGSSPEIVGEPYRDASGTCYGPLVRQPILVFGAGADGLGKALRRATERGLRVSIYTRDLFATNNDLDNRAAVAAVPTDALDLVGLAVLADRKDVDKVTKGLTLHP
jgi:hypothetical protein